MILGRSVYQDTRREWTPDQIFQFQEIHKVIDQIYVKLQFGTQKEHSIFFWYLDEVSWCYIHFEKNISAIHYHVLVDLVAQAYSLS